MKKAILEDVDSAKLVLTNVKERVAAAIGQKADDAILQPLTGEPCLFSCSVLCICVHSS